MFKKVRKKKIGLVNPICEKMINLTTNQVSTKSNKENIFTHQSDNIKSGNTVGKWLS